MADDSPRESDVRVIRGISEGDQEVIRRLSGVIRRLLDPG